MKTRAAVARQGIEGFSMEAIEIDSPRPDEILVRVTAVGICHTDLVFKASGGAMIPSPAVFGHEGAGIVEAIGADVTKVEPGDHVLMTFRSCGACDHCHAGDVAYCRNWMQFNVSGGRTDGSRTLRQSDGTSISSNFFGQSSFAGHALAYERNVVAVAPDLPLEILCPLGCAIQTGAGAVMRSFAARAGSSILITGGGPVGLSAVMGAAIRQCAQIILVEPIASRRQLATRFGATRTIDPTGVTDLAASIREVVPQGVDYAFETTGIPAVQAASMASLGMKGTLGLVGSSPLGTHPPGDINIVIGLGQSIRGILEGDSDPDRFIPELIGHYRAGRLPAEEMVTLYQLSEIDRAVADQKNGVCIKAVLVPDT